MYEPLARSELSALRTPCLLLDRAALQRNVNRMAAQVRGLEVDLRPHVKTAKSPEIARLASAGFSGAITVSTVREAEFFFEHGFRDILYAVGIAHEKIAPLAVLALQGATITIVADNEQAIAAIKEPVASSGAKFGVLIEIDVDGYRCGVSPDKPDFIAVAQAVAGVANLTLRGVMSYAGLSYDETTPEGIRKISELHRETTLRASNRLREADFPVSIVSVGSTPTTAFSVNARGITEVRAGVYVFQDLYQVGLGVCPMADVALSVLCTVIGHVKHAGGIAVDAGGLALSKDRSTSTQPNDFGYGLVCDLAGSPIADLVVASTGQEHGLIRRLSGTPIDTSQFPIGSPLRILPNHACMTAAAYDRYYVLDSSKRIEGVWQRCNGW